MKILVIGASSYTGSRIYYDLNKSFKTVGTYNSNKLSPLFIHLDLTDKKQIEEIIFDQKPDVIVHVANHASSRPAEEDEKRYLSINLKATEHIVNVSNKIGSKVVFISSFAALNPVDIYGQSKLKSENVVKNTKAGYLILRPYVILGYSPNITNDRPFNRVLKCLDDKILAKFDTSWNIYPTYVGHLSQIIEQTIVKDLWNQTLPVLLNHKVTQYQFAKDVLSHFNILVEAIDKGYDIPDIKSDLTLLEKYDLKPKNYDEMIDEIVQSIKNEDNFVLK
ncbi:sugar nucleotide-binding protein [Patescibacteria group bacterium]|nr:sugar nucleotide-binding protein [Patescibacteria group bacterium]